MRGSRRPSSRGFTLLELMIVVAIVGVLAALAIYGVRKYLLSAKTAEARNAVGQMTKDAKAAYDRDTMSGVVLPPGGMVASGNQLCTDASKPVPANKSSIAGQKYQSTEAEWIVDQASVAKGFACLKFTMTDPQYYMYSYTGTSGRPASSPRWHKAIWMPMAFCPHSR